MMQVNNPAALAAYVAATILSVPAIIALVNMIMFFSNMNTTMKTLVDSFKAFSLEMRDYRHEKNDQIQQIFVSQALAENDINGLQAHVGLAVTKYPERQRRIGDS